MNPSLAKGKDPGQLESDDRQSDFAEGVEGESVTDTVDNDCAITSFLKGVSVMPLAIRSLDLLIYETMRRFPLGNECSPPESYPHKAQSIVDQSARSHLQRGGSENSEPELRRCKKFKIPRFGEEGEDLFQRPRCGRPVVEFVDAWVKRHEGPGGEVDIVPVRDACLLPE